MHDKIFALAEEVKTSFPGTTTEVQTYPSGAAMLDVRWRDRLFVVCYSPAGGFGVDEVGEGEGFEMGYRFLAPDLGAAAGELYRLLQAASLNRSE